MNDQAIEQEIQAKGKTAPRVTPADIEANIASEHYFTAAHGVIGAQAHSLSLANGGRVENHHFHVDDDTLGLLTFCVLVLRNGFTVTGESACASPENFDAEIGRNIARQNAVQKIWPLMGYQLRDELHRRAQFAAESKTSDEERMQKHLDMVREAGWTPVEVITTPSILPAILTSTLQPHQQRVVDEKAELDDKLQKLNAFTRTPIFTGLDGAERERLERQAVAMAMYSNILGHRIAAFAPAAAI